eukprot:CAMPEP_0171086158 /NCGR_PEP_ID=MMETSP0766_2-20121228/19375_1 /TAXON_ID=439317 /ORGANISM="Gambierdiscus australes, Strain CAWD 149" /LENGTH=134 /DNA_ID=CAMNT_0011543777 /DNA_START=282 /DNA_END=688 /DNA_ORIENTATION=+
MTDAATPPPPPFLGRLLEVCRLWHATEVHEDTEIHGVTLLETSPLVPMQENILVGELFPEFCALDETVSMELVFDEQADVALPSSVCDPRNWLGVWRSEAWWLGSVRGTKVPMPHAASSEAGAAPALITAIALA